MELSIESGCQSVSWKVRDFFQLPSEIGYFLDSPEFRFADDSYSLRLYPNGSLMYDDGDFYVELDLVRLTSTFPERNSSVKVGYRESTAERDLDLYISALPMTLITLRSYLDNRRNRCVPGGTFTALCYMRLVEQSSSRNPLSDEVETSDAEEEQKGLLGQSVVFSSRWCSSKMELSTVSPYQHVTWEIPDFFQLLSKTGYYLNSPDFLFAGDRYCFRFYPKGERNRDAADTVLQLVRLTSTFPERTLLYKVGNKYSTIYVYHYSGILIHEIGFCFLLSKLEKDKDYNFPIGTLTVVCFMHLKEQDSAGIPQSEEAGNSRSEEKQKRLPVIPDSVSCAVHTEVSDSVIEKENFKNEDWSSLDTEDVTLLSERMKDLLKKGIDHDLTICVQNKEFRAHRSILSARSPVFAMMLTHDTKESNTGTISIEDCDPDSFDDFLLYVYSGRTENLTPSKALQLYYTADKYDFSALKERCVRLLKTSLSTTSICDVVLLAAKHKEKELLEVASDFFARNVEKILITVEWQRFLSQNPVEANELYINSIKFYLPKKSRMNYE